MSSRTIRGTSEKQTISPVLGLLLEAASLGDDASVSNILTLLTVAEASQADPRPMSTTYGLTALHRAKTPEVARVLLEYGLPINCRGPLGQTPLHTCCDNPPVLRLLLERGADLGATTSDGSTALEWAVVADSVESVMLLLEKGASVQSSNKNGNTPLHLVSSRRMAEVLLAHGAKVSVENLEGKIPLETAAERQGEPDFAAITELLLDVSEDRGLRYRNKKSAPKEDSLREHKSADSFGEAADKKEKVRKRWSIVRERVLGHRDDPGRAPFLGQTQRRNSLLDVIGAARARSGTMTKEWHNEETMAAVEGESMHTSRNGSFVDARFEDLTDEDEEEGADGAGSKGEDSVQEDRSEHSGFYMRFFELAIRERPFLAKKMLDRHRTFLYAKGTAKYYLYDLTLLGGIDSISDALRLIVEYDRRELVSHDVVQWLVTAKWGLFTQRFVMREAILYLFFIILFIMSTLKTFLPKIVSEYTHWVDLGLFLLSIRYLGRLILEWVHRGKTLRVAQSIFRADRFTGPVFVIMLGILFGRYVLGMLENSFEERVMETMGSVMLWVRVLYFAEAQYRLVGLTMSIVRRMIADITVYVCVQMVFLVGFAHAMTIALRGLTPADPNFGSPLRSFASLVFFIFNLDSDTVYDIPDAERRRVAMVLLAIYESLVVVLFLNLVIAVMTTSFEEVMSNAKSEWLLVRAKICVRMEDQTSAALFASSAKRHIQRLKLKRTAIVMERANGENEVSLPVSLRPPSIFYGEFMVALLLSAKDYLLSLCSNRSRAGYEPISESPLMTGPPAPLSSPGHQVSFDSADAHTSRMTRQTSGGTVVDALTGKGEESFVVGTFTRYSVLNAEPQQQQQPQAQQASQQQVPQPTASPTPAQQTRRLQMSDDDVIRSLRQLLGELEKRKGTNKFQPDI